MTQSKRISIEVLDAVVDGQIKGAVFEVEAKTAEYLAAIGYVKIVEEAPKQAKAVSAKKAE